MVSWSSSSCSMRLMAVSCSSSAVALLHHALGALLVVPQRGVFRLLVELGKPRACLVDVKDASSAARSTA